jgi:hypothetical protein
MFKSFITILILFTLCLFGTSLKTGSGVLISPEVAFIGVVVSNVFLLFGLLGWDVASIIRGQDSNRFAGLFIEPSHFALYVGPLWLFAFQLKNRRPWLYLFLCFNIITCFSLTMGAFICLAVLVKLYADGIKVKINLKKTASFFICLLTIVLVFVYSTIEEKPLALYIAERIGGVFSDDETVNLSSLAALQGFELAKLSILSTYGIGVGIGNMGFSDRINNQSYFYNIITTIMDGGTLCLHDGSMLANKIVTEFGVFGLIIIPFFLYKYAYALRHTVSRKNTWYYQSLFAFLLVYLFVRGASFLTAPCCLAILALFSVRNNLLCSTKGLFKANYNNVVAPITPNICSIVPLDSVAEISPPFLLPSSNEK